MKYSLLIILLVLCCGCTATIPEIPEFEDSNAHLIKETVESIQIADSLAPYINENENIIFVSLEKDKTDDNAIPSLIEDVCIKQLVDYGYNVLERDDNTLYRLMSESGNKFTYIERIKRQSSENAGESAFSPGIILERPSYHEQKYSNFVEKENYHDLLNTPLAAADKIVSYRIIESGIIYEELCGSQACDSLKRISDTRLLLRTADAKTGQILNISNLRGMKSDIILNDNRKNLENYHMHFYRYGYPVSYSNPEQWGYSVKRNQNNESHNIFWKLIGGVALIGGFSALALNVN